MGHSAANTLLALALVRLRRQEPDTRISWVVRAASPTRLYGGGKADQIPARGALRVRGARRGAVRRGHAADRDHHRPPCAPGRLGACCQIDRLVAGG